MSSQQQTLTNLYVITSSETQFPKSGDWFKHVIYGSTAEKIAQSHATMKRKAVKDRTESAIEAKKSISSPGLFPVRKQEGRWGRECRRIWPFTYRRTFIFTWTGALAIGCFLNWSSSLEVFHSHIYQPKKYKDKRTSSERNDMWKTNTT